MEPKELYLEMQKLSGIKEGDLVQILRKSHEEEMGWACAWVDEMDPLVGKAGCVTEVGELGITVYFSTYRKASYLFPFFVLEVLCSHNNLLDKFGNLQEVTFNHINLTHSLLGKIKEAAEKRDIREFHRHKKDLLLHLAHLHRFIKADTCPYCNGNTPDCKTCEYGKKHGICGEEGSDWNGILDALSDLTTALQNY
jgi:hypothetical protein